MALLAVRVAGACFDGPLSLRSPRFEALLDEHDEVLRTLDALSDRLVATLHDLVPEAPDRATRRRLLGLKRAVFNRRPLPEPPGLLERPTLLALRRFERLRRRQAALFETHRAAVIAEVRAGIRSLIGDDRFRLACRYTSPALEADLRSTGLPDGHDLTALERGLYSHAARFISKANPFHLFGEVAFSAGAGLTATDPHEVVVDFSLILDLEHRLLPYAGDGRVWMALVPFHRKARTVRFWVPARHGLKLLSFDQDEILEIVLRFFRQRTEHTGKPVGRRRHWHDFLRASTAGRETARAEESLSQLVRCGVVQEHLVTDPTSLGRSLGGVDPVWDSCVAAVDRHHLSMKRSTELAGAHSELSAVALRIGGGEGRTPPFFVNSYRTIDTRSLGRALRPAMAQLVDLKPILSASHNFQNHAWVIRAYVRDLLEYEGVRRIPYLTLLRHYLTHREEIVARYVAAAPFRDRLRSSRQVNGRLSSLEGELSRDRLRALTREIGVEPRDSLCFVGPFDPVDETLYLTNVFAGNGRYLRRYLLGRRPIDERPVACREGELDVELAVPPPPNLNYVARVFPTGCGFEPRWAHRYEQWIDPADVLVERSDDRLIYRWAERETLLNIHYCGLQLVQHLPGEYHPFLLGHADAFDNPFLRQPAPDDTEEVRYTPALRYGRVCLRRESWSVLRGALAALLGESDSLRFASRLRDELRGRFGSGAEHWYCSVDGLGRRSHKPRFLDLRNPLSAHAFRRSLQSIEEGGRISFAEMHPAADRLLRVDSERRVTELMIEV